MISCIPGYRPSSTPSRFMQKPRSVRAPLGDAASTSASSACCWSSSCCSATISVVTPKLWVRFTA
ncbi:Uncharacterised protein [Mycobacterium tuberculosis]|uniref:Uncharacterized protein n=1 Tax=Mycobacterium tuberculosis TaxID=1773 RepID=A0A916LGN0_MYCTX|nr:Uncharacterised protein [Mycobacterium tuberculosis]